MTDATEQRHFSLARKDDMALFLHLLLHQGAICHKCGHGTRVTSKRWAKCKSCGERVRRETCREPKPEEEAR